MELIQNIFYENKQRYGFKRITAELRNRGYLINHKKVLRLMSKLGLRAVKKKQNYHSYIGLKRNKIIIPISVKSVISRIILSIETSKRTNQTKNGQQMFLNLTVRLVNVIYLQLSIWGWEMLLLGIYHYLQI